MPSLVIFVGLRSCFSLAGILGIVLGTFLTEREWDDETDNEIFSSSSYKLNEEDDSSERPVPVSELLSSSSSLVLLTGWFFLAISQIFSNGWGIQIMPGIFSLFFLLALGCSQTVLLRRAMISRKVEMNRVLWLLGAGFMIEGIMLGVSRSMWVAYLGGEY